MNQSGINASLTRHDNTTNCVPWGNNWWEFAQPVQYQWSSSTTQPTQLLGINCVENGFRVSHAGKEYVFESLKSLLTFIQDKLSG